MALFKKNILKHLGVEKWDKIEKPCIQKAKAEKYLGAQLDKICNSVDIQLSEWNLDKQLLKAIVNSHSAGNKTALKRFSEYDLSYSLIEELGVKVSSKYRWFTNIAEYKPNQTNQ